MRTLNACPVCASEAAGHRAVTSLDARAEGQSLTVRLVECPSCRHVYLNPQPTPDELGPFYRESYHVFADQFPDRAETARKTEGARERGRYNHALVRPGGRYLDVGCGLGTMVMAMDVLGMESVGVEPSEVAVRRAREAGLNVIKGMLHEANLPGESFDTVSMYHVLEHTPEPVEVLRECRRVLKPGGEIVIGVPNFDSNVYALIGKAWSALDPPRHLQHFRASSMRRAAEAAGLTVTDLSTESLPHFVAQELAVWLRRRLFVPIRLTRALGFTKPLAARLASAAEKSGRGEALIARLTR